MLVGNGVQVVKSMAVAKEQAKQNDSPVHLRDRG